MLKTRIIPCLTIKDLRLVKSVRFREHRNIGSYLAAVRVFNARDVDEMIVLDLDARTKGLKPQLMGEIAKECFMPLTVGGGIKTLDDIQLLLKLGADKVAVNTAALEKPEFLGDASKIFGAQCVVVSIDVNDFGGRYEVMSHNAAVATGRSPLEWAKEAEARGAGEIFLTSIDRDGTMQGYDVQLVRQVTAAVHIPVIASGGAGNLAHCLNVVTNGGASAIAAASIFQYTQVTPQNIKAYFSTAGIETRI